MSIPVYKNILLATELSNHSDYTAERAKSMADRYGAKLTIVHALEPFVAYASAYFTLEMREELVEEAKKNLEAFCKKYNVSKKDQYVALGTPKEVILALAKKLDVDLIILGSHDKSWLSPLIGSTTTNVMSSADCDVLTISVRHILKQSKQNAQNEALSTI